MNPTGPEFREAARLLRPHQVGLSLEMQALKLALEHAEDSLRAARSFWHILAERERERFEEAKRKGTGL